MKLNVEFLGLSRRLAQTKEVLLELDDRATFRDVLRELATRFPALVGPVITPKTFDLVPAHMINVDGRRVVSDLDTQPQDGQRLIIMFVEAGG
jgi:molybdopterin converting factor small subunit